jgi:hypothetical protein
LTGRRVPLDAQVPERSRRRPLLWRGAAVLAVGALAVGALAITPATAGKFLTKKKASNRYLGNTSEVTTTVSVAPNDGAQIQVLCPPGQQAVGGGADSPRFIGNPSDTEFMLILESDPLFSGGRATGWSMEVLSTGSNPVPVTAHVVCSA